jgi:uncharacterized spore protein YtfJ
VFLDTLADFEPGSPAAPPPVPPGRHSRALGVDRAPGVDVLTAVRDKLTVKTAIGEPMVHNGLTIVPVARISAGGGAGTGREEAAQKAAGAAGATGQGVGFGVRSAPVGVFVIRDDKVTWRPSVDVSKVILGGQVVAIVALLTVRSIIKARSRR